MLSVEIFMVIFIGDRGRKEARSKFFAAAVSHSLTSLTP
jgi:hypothetical protein